MLLTMILTAPAREKADEQRNGGAQAGAPYEEGVAAG